MRSLLSASFLYSLALTAVTVASPLNTSVSRGHAARAVEGKGIIVQLFEWNWDSVASECTNFLGPNGYRYVQVSPPQEHIQGSQWWTDYQPVSYQLVSKRGNREAFSRMIQTCKSAGVGIIADTIWNHMTGQNSGTGTAGSSFTKYNYPGTYSSADFHYCGLQPGNEIRNYGNRQEVQTCQLVGLADLATESEYVRSRLAQFSNDMLSLGVEGLRLDAAKHIAAGDIQNIVQRLNGSPFITQEVIFGAGEAVQPGEYVGAGDVQEFRYTSTIRDAFQGSNIAGLENLDNRGWISSNQATVFVANHDTERNGASLNTNAQNNAYALAHVFMLAHPYGTPSVLSSYSFSNTDAGAPNNNAGACTSNGGANGWLCQHRWPAIAGMVSFWNQVKGQPLSGWSTDGSSRISFSRGSSGFVAINSGDSSWSRTFSTGLPPGTYCDVTTGRIQGGRCTGNTYTINSSRQLTATIPPRSAIGVHIGPASFSDSLEPLPNDNVQINFRVYAETVFGQNIFVVGDRSELGGWDTSKAIALSSASYPTWTGTVTLPSGTAFQYKYIRKESNGAVTWESGSNRAVTAPGSGSTTLQDTWR